jgi:hypothetical protein
VRIPLLMTAVVLTLAPMEVSAQQNPDPPHRSQILAGSLGFVIPGLGHAYAGETKRGLIVFGVTMAGAFAALSDGMPNGASVPGSLVMLGGWTFSVVDGVLAARRFNRRRATQP